MKQTHDPRHEKRRKIVKILFAESYTGQNSEEETVQKIVKRLVEIDEMIKASAPTWPIEKLNKIDLAILRLAVFELLEGENPPKVVIDEAIEVAKEFGSESSSSFVNGVLGTIYKSIQANPGK